jgi:hypothetical protein
MVSSNYYDDIKRDEYGYLIVIPTADRSLVRSCE